MSNSESNKHLVLTAAEVRRWQAECESIDHQTEDLAHRKEALLKKIAAAELLAPSLFEEDQLLPAQGGGKIIRKRKGRTTWTSVIEEQIRSSGTGIRQRQVLENMRNGPYGERLKASESGYYNAVQKLLKRDILVKRGDYLFTHAQYDEYMSKLERGEVRDVAEEGAFGSAAAAEIVRFVGTNPGQRSIALIKAVWEAHKGAHPPSKTSLYNTIARLVEQKHIRKEDGRFYPYEDNEVITEDDPESTSEDGEIGSSPSLSESDEKVTPLFAR